MRTWILSPLLSLVLIAAGVTVPEEPPSLAGGRGRIKGTVSGPDRHSLTAARVMARVALDDRDIIYLTTTDDSGTYYFENLPAGNFVLAALAEGMSPGRYEDVDVRPPFRSILDFRLVPVATAGAAAAPADEGMAPPAGAATGVVEVRGLVLAEKDAALPDAEVAFAGGPPPGHRLVFSRQDGRLFLPDLPAARYELRVTAPGTIPIRVPDVVVRPGRLLELAIRLVDYPVEMAARRGVILPPEEPLPPRRYLAIPPGPAAPPPPPPAAPPPAADPEAAAGSAPHSNPA